MSRVPSPFAVIPDGRTADPGSGRLGGSVPPSRSRLFGRDDGGARAAAGAAP